MTYASDVLALSPSIYYIMDQTTGSPVESVSGRSTSINTTYTWGVTGPVSGYTALDFSGGNATLTRLALTGDQTRAGWVKTTSTDNTVAYTGDCALPLLGDFSGAVWDCFGITGGKAEFRRFNNSTWDIVTGATSVNDGNWHHIAMTYNSTTRAVRIFVDGVQDATGTIAAHQVQGGINNIGNGFNAGDLFIGSVAHLCAWNSIVSDANITVLATPGPIPASKSDTDSFTLSEATSLAFKAVKTSTDSFALSESELIVFHKFKSETDRFQVTDRDFLNYVPTPPLGISFTGHRVYATFLASGAVTPNTPRPTRTFAISSADTEFDIILLDESQDTTTPTGTFTLDIGTPGDSVRSVTLTGPTNNRYTATFTAIPPGVYSARVTVDSGGGVLRSYPTEAITLVVT